MKVSLSLDKKDDNGAYWRIYYYCPRPGARPKKVSLARFQADFGDLDKSRQKAEKVPDRSG